ncbi:YihY/virulence factor BrkB family protein [Thioclava sp. GXIMD4216]|uniref:YihY/virulence factor BrkB family protein n=1 Tax=Thioclava litoralis TaxID=3076557 RepID=A0ABZ1DX71_9RHOB|nr:YihY/virulence factor BrkB family protein [Thioclava sp. FTW29]
MSVTPAHILRVSLNFSLQLLGRLAATNIGLISAGVAFYAMLAIFPGVSATIAIWTAFADANTIRTYLAVADNFIPPQAWNLLYSQIQSWLISTDSTIGWGTIASLGVTLFSARAGVGALVLGLNVIHGTKPRNTIWSIFFAYFMTLALVAVMIGALATIVAVPVFLNILPFHNTPALIALTNLMLSWLPWGAMFLLMLTVLGILYRYGPRKMGRPREKIFTFGAVIATLVWGAASFGLTFYLSHFASYSKLYGSIGAVIALLLWLYLSAFAILFGAAFNAEWRKERTGSTKPLD